MSFIKKTGVPNILMLILCLAIIVVSEYVFLNVDKLNGLFIGMWAPTLLGFLIYLKLVQNGRK